MSAASPRDSLELQDVRRMMEGWTRGERDAWERMGQQLCSVCRVPLRPCPKGPGADEPGYVGFFRCACEGGGHDLRS